MCQEQTFLSNSLIKCIFSKQVKWKSLCYKHQFDDFCDICMYLKYV